MDPLPPAPMIGNQHTPWEYRVLRFSEITTTESIECDLNSSARNGWEIACSVGDRVILRRRPPFYHDPYAQFDPYAQSDLY